MAAITTPLLAREAMNQLAKREKNWAAQNVGVMVVFCIVFVGMLPAFPQSMRCCVESAPLTWFSLSRCRCHLHLRSQGPPEAQGAKAHLLRG